MIVKIEEPRVDRADLSDWQKLLYRTTMQGGGLNVFDFSNRASSAIPAIMPGSVFQFNSAVYSVTATETILNWNGMGNNTWCYAYIRLGNDGNAEFYWSNDKPTFQVQKGGWFHRSYNWCAIMFCYKLTSTTCRNKAKISSIDNIDAVYPVNAIYEHTWDMNPQEWMLDTVWERFGDGRVLVGVANNTMFNAAELTGGEEAHVLSVAEMPSHKHNLNHVRKAPLNQGATVTGIEQSTIEYSTSPYGSSGGENFLSDAYVQAAGGAQHTLGSYSTIAHNNLQPYITVYRYKRTA